MLGSLRIAVRSLARRPAISLVAVISLAVGIGVNSAVFSVVDAFLRPPAVNDPYGLVTIAAHFRDSGSTIISWPDYEDIRSGTSAFSEVAAYSQRGASFRSGDENVHLRLTVASDNYFAVIGLRPMLGNVPGPNHDYAADPEPPVIVSYGFWQKRLGGKADVVGQRLELTRRFFRVAAVLPAEFRGFETTGVTDLWMPIGSWTKAFRAKVELQRGNGQFEAIGRLRAGTTLRQAQAQLDLLAKRIESENSVVPRGRALVVHSLGEELHQRFLPGILVLATVGLVLLAACANVASVLLVHADARRREIGIRIAVGASRVALTRQFLLESSTLAAAGAGCGLLLARWLLAIIPALSPPSPFPITLDMRFDHRLLLFTTAASVMAVVLFGVAPILYSLRTQVAAAIGASDRGAIGTPRAWLRGALVTTQIAISIVLVGGAAVLLGQLAEARKIYTGLDSARPMVLAHAGIEQSGTDMIQPFQSAADRLAAIPGVAAVTYARHVPLWASGSGASVSVLPGGASADAVPMRVGFNLTGPRYFETVGAKILRGRSFSDAECRTGTRSAILNATGAARFFGNEDPIGKLVRLARENGQAYQVVGIVADDRNSSIHETPKPYVYFPFAAMRWGEATMLTVTNGSAGPVLKDVTRAIQSTGELRVEDATTLETHLSDALYQDWMPTVLGTALASIGLILAAGGLYGAVSYAANRRRREFGVRLAMGARAGQIGALVLRQAILLCAFGVSLGGAAFALAWRHFGPTLLGGKPLDLAALGMAGVVTIAVVLAGALLPVIRAARVDPVEVLRSE